MIFYSVLTTTFFEGSCLLQIAHAINQLVEKEKEIQAIPREDPKESVHNLRFKLKGYMMFVRQRGRRKIFQK
ncbi:MAG: hypothetical protein LBL90_12480 [Prevotellaceae bacterium]|jgi:hypothetical protein|nr:hypothetical protein [Prevotellaceae bacterium]